MGFDLKIKRPRILPGLVSAEDIASLNDAIRGHSTHKASTVGDLLLIDTTIKSGMRRAELANLKVASIRVVQELLGHSNLNTTQVYLSVTGNHLEEAIGLLDE